MEDAEVAEESPGGYMREGDASCYSIFIVTHAAT